MCDLIWCASDTLMDLCATSNLLGSLFSIKKALKIEYWYMEPQSKLHVYIVEMVLLSASKQIFLLKIDGTLWSKNTKYLKSQNLTD